MGSLSTSTCHRNREVKNSQRNFLQLVAGAVASDPPARIRPAAVNLRFKRFFEDKQPRDRNGQFISFQQRNHELEKQVKNLERVVSLAAEKIGALQVQLQLSDKHLERRVKQIDSMEAKRPAHAEKARASGQAAAQAECTKVKRLHDSVSAKLLRCQQDLAMEQDRRAAAEAMAKDAQSQAKRLLHTVG